MATLTTDSVESVLKMRRSLSVPKSTDVLDHYQPGFKPVLVLSHPSMREMALNLVQITTSKMMKLKLEVSKAVASWLAGSACSTIASYMVMSDVYCGSIIMVLLFSTFRMRRRLFTEQWRCGIM